MIVPTLCVGMPQRTLGVRLWMGRRASRDAFPRGSVGTIKFSGAAQSHVGASLLCGYIGMVEKIEPSAAVEGRAYERRNLRLPITIEEALTQMEDCPKVAEYLGSKFVRGYVAVKRAEHENFKRVISSWEREFLLLSV